MSALVIILLGTVLIQSSSIAAGDRDLPARGFTSNDARGAAFTLISVTLSAVMGFAATRYVLEPCQLDYLRTPVIVLATVAIIFLTRLLARDDDGEPHPDVLAVLTNQCALLGAALFTAFFSQSLMSAMVCGLAAAVALVILSAAFKALMERIDRNLVPFVFRGIPIALITAGFMALALMGFVGIVRN